MSESHGFYLVDAFTKSHFGGNQAAVIIAGKTISDEVKQRLAAEFNLSETAFPEPRNGDYKTASHFDLRWFTPTVEIDLCGHATLATAHVIFNEIGNQNSELIFETVLRGNLSVIRGENGHLAMNFPQYDIVSLNFDGQNAFSDRFLEVQAPNFLPDLLNCIHFGELKLQGIVHTPVGKKLVVVLDGKPTRDQFAQLSCDYNKMLEIVPTDVWLHGIIVTFSPKSPEQGFVQDDGTLDDYVCRFFAPWSGVNEDPATGSAQCGLGPFWRAVLNKKQLKGHQAYSGRGADFIISFPSEGRVQIEGNTVTVVKGQLSL